MRSLDLGIPSELSFALGPDLLLMGGSMILLLWAAWRPESVRHQRAVGIACLLLTLVTAGAVVWYMTRDVGVGPGAIALDGFRWVADLIFLLGTALTIALTLDYNTREGIGTAEVHVLILLATAGMMLLAAARDLMIVFLGIELMSISVYALAAMNRRSARGAEGALKYFLLGAFSTAILLYGIALVYGATGATNLTTIGIRALAFGLTGSPMLSIGIALMLVGFGFKVAAAPFHMWAPDVYEGAPAPITAYMAAAVKAAAFASFLRIWLEAFPMVFERWHVVVVGLAVVTMIAGNVIALAQRNVKRILAYSSIAHAGYLLVAIAVGTAAATSAFLFYAIAYTLATMGAFGVVAALAGAGEANTHVDDYAGLWSTRPWLAAAMAVFMLALLGFPVFGGMGFFAKLYLIQAALQGRDAQLLLSVTMVLTSVVSAGYYLYVVMVMFMKPRREGAAAPGRSFGMTSAVIAFAAVVILVLGVWPTGAIDLSRRGVPSPPRLTTAGPPLPAAPAR